MERYPQAESMHRRERWIGFDAFDDFMAEVLDEVEVEPVEELPELPDEAA